MEGRLSPGSTALLPRSWTRRRTPARRSASNLGSQVLQEQWKWSCHENWPLKNGLSHDSKTLWNLNLGVILSTPGWFILGHLATTGTITSKKSGLPEIPLWQLNMAGWNSSIFKHVWSITEWWFSHCCVRLYSWIDLLVISGFHYLGVLFLAFHHLSVLVNRCKKPPKLLQKTPGTVASWENTTIWKYTGYRCKKHQSQFFWVFPYPMRGWMGLILGCTAWCLMIGPIKTRNLLTGLTSNFLGGKVPQSVLANHCCWSWNQKRGDGLDSFAGLTPAMQLPCMFFVTQNLSEETEEEVPVCRRRVGSSWWPCDFCQLLRVFERAGFPCIFKKVKPWAMVKLFPNISTPRSTCSSGPTGRTPQKFTAVPKAPGSSSTTHPLFGSLPPRDGLWWWIRPRNGKNAPMKSISSHENVDLGLTVHAQDSQGRAF